MKKKLILIQLNEINFDLVKKYLKILIPILTLYLPAELL